MKTYVLFIIMFDLSFCIVFGKIKNGYESQLKNSEEALQKLHAMLQDNSELSGAQRRKIKSRIEDMEDHILYYHLTEELLHQLKIVSPDIHSEMDTIKDKKGRATDVYVKVIPLEQATIDLEGATFFSQASGDEDKSTSEYGEGTISIRILITSNLIVVLCHELGHVKHIVPNLAHYMKFHKIHYAHLNFWYMGHDIDDRSGVSAEAYESKFRKDYALYLRDGGMRFESAISRLHRFRKNFQHRDDLFSPSLLSKNYP